MTGSIRRARSASRLAVGLSLCAALTGCGAAYYGTALGIVASQKDKKTIDQSFPDAVPTGVVTPSIATLVLSTSTETIDRDLSTFNPAGLIGSGRVTRTDYQVLGVEFPAGYGEARSNRDADTTLVDGDRLVVRVNGDQAQELLFGAGDVASTGDVVATRIRDKVRALAPQDPQVSPAAYLLFDASYDPVSRSYVFTSGAPGEDSEVVFEPAPRQSAGDDEPDADSTATATRLGLGVAQGGIELAGADSVRFVVLNRGTDVLPAGTRVDLYLSHDKVLDTRLDLPFDRVTLDQSLAVGEARRFARRNGNAPPVDLLREDLTDGLYYVLFAVDSGGEQITTNNLVASAPVLVSLPYDDPAAPPGVAASPVDLAPTSTVSPISLVADATLPFRVTLTNLGAPVVAPAPVDLDLVLSLDSSFDEPGGFTDPTGVIPVALRLNADDPNRPVTVELDDTGTPLTPTVSVAGLTVTVAYDPAVHTVAEVSARLQANAGSLLDAFTTGTGDPTAVLMEDLATAYGDDVTTTGDTFVASRRVNFAPADRPQATQTFVLDGVVRATSLRTNLLPLKVVPLVRVRPDNGPGAPDNAQNNLRPAANYVRVYDRSRATTDPNTSAVLPTVNSDDFATLDAVTQRPVNAGSIRQGQQRVLRFELPPTGLTVEESQLLVILRTTNFDAHIDLLNAQGVLLTSADDSGLGRDPVIYTSVQATSGTRFFYVVVSTARADESDLAGGGETFELTISINQRQTSDAALAAATRVPNTVLELPQRYEPGAQRTVNDVAIPFTLANGKAEVGFVLPQRARVRFATRPLFTVGVDTEITGFVRSFVPFPLEHQAVLDPSAEGVIYRPTGGTVATSHILEPGVYTFAIESIGGGDSQPLRLELDTQFIPD